MGAKLPLPIQTPRLVLRCFKTEDLQDYLEFAMDEESYKYLDDYPSDEKEAINWFEEAKLKRLTDVRGYLALGLESRKDVKTIGYLVFWLIDRSEARQGTFQIIVSPSYRDQGYGTEAVLGVIDFAFNGVALHDIRVGLNSGNVAGRRMVEKAGMRLEGEFKEGERVKGNWISTAQYAILGEDYGRAGVSM
jgi:RimJ/RimL family protein N-acetyltransferase